MSKETDKEKAVQALTRGRGGVQRGADKPASVQASKQTKKPASKPAPKPVQKLEPERVTPFSTYLRPSLQKRLKVQAATSGQKITVLLEQAVLDYLERHGG
jgi:hypothetical protein